MKLYVLIGLLSLMSIYASAAPSKLTYQGRILKADKTPLTYNNVSFEFSILADDNDACVLYREQVAGVDLSQSAGIFEVSFGLASSAAGWYYKASEATTFDDLFKSGSFTCEDSSVYSATSTSTRNLKVRFYDGVAWQSLDNKLTLNSVPFASVAAHATKTDQATNSLSLGGVAASSYLQKPAACIGGLIGFDGTSLTCTPISTLSVEWTSVANKPSTFAPSAHTHPIDQITSAAGKYLTYQPNNVACAVGEVLKWDGTNWLCGTDNSGVGSAISALTADVSASGTGSVAATVNSVGGKTAAQIASAVDDINNAGTVYLAKAGGTMSGAINMNGQNLTNLGYITMNPSVTFHLSNNATAPGSLTAADKGKMWFNSASNVIEYWDGSTVKAVSEGTQASDLTSITGTGIVQRNGAGSYSTLGVTAPLAVVAGNLVLNNTAVTAGSYGSATQVGTFTVDAQGRLTAASNVTVTPAWSSITGAPTTVDGFGLTDALKKTGDVMTGSLGLGNYTNATETTLTSGWATGDKGKTWFNTTSNQVKYWDGSAAVALGVSGAGLTSLNGQTGSTQTFAIGTTGTAPAYSSSSNTHTLNIPMASAAGVTAGLLSKTEYDAFAGKQAAGNYITALTGDVTAAGPGSAAATIAANAVTSGKIADGTIVGADMDFTGVNASTSGIAIKDSTGKFFNFTCGTNGHVATWTASGWACQAAAATGVTSVSSANSDISVATGTTTPVLTLNSGTAGGAGDANKIAKLNASGVLAANMIPSLDASKITTGTLPIANGGTGATTASVARTNLGLGTAATKNTGGASGDVPVVGVAGITNNSMCTSDGSGAITCTTAIPSAGVTAIDGLSDAITVTTGANNLFMGASAGNASVTGARNIGVGRGSVLAALAGGNDNTVYGFDSGKLLANGSGNTVVGSSAMRTGVNINESIAIGNYAMDGTSSGNKNTAIGYAAMANATGSYNIAIGDNVLKSISNGYDNVVIGRMSLASTTSANGNVTLGTSALQSLASGDDNIAIGAGAGYGPSGTGALTTGTGNIFIGKNVVGTAATISNQLNIGNAIFGDLATGNIGIGTSSPGSKFDVKGDIRASGSTSGYVGLRAPASGGNVTYTLPATGGTSGQVLTTNGAAGVLSWTTPSAGGLTSLNGLTAGTQTFAIGTTGTAPAFSSATSTHTLNIPMASAAGVTAGLLSKTDYDAFSAKQAAGNYITALTGDVTATGPGSVAATIAGNAVTSAKIANGTIVGADMDFTGVNVATSSIAIKDNTGKFFDFNCSTAGHVATWTVSGWACQAPSGGVTGSGTANYIPVFSGSTSLGNSPLTVSSGKIGLGVASPFGLFANNSNNTAGSDGTGMNSSSGFNWSINTVGYSGAFHNAVNSAGANGLAVKVSNTAATTVALDVSVNPAQGSAGTPLLTVLGSGRVGIGTTAPASALHVVGDIQFTGTLTDISDRRLKENIVPIESGLNSLMKIQVYSYVMKDDPKKRTEYGVMAQDLAKVIPNLVKTVDANGNYYGVNYIGLIPFTIKAVQELNTELHKQKREVASALSESDEKLKAVIEENEELKASIKLLMKKMNEQEARLQRLESK